MEHWGSIRLQVTKASQLKEKLADPVTGKEKEEYIGHIFRLTVKKSKVSTPNRRAELFLVSAPYKGLDITENIYRVSTEQMGLISKGTWRVYISDDGTEYKMYNKDWVPFLDSPEGAPIRKEIFQKQLKKMFPKGYPPLNNATISVDHLPLLEGMKEYYAEVQKADLEKDI